MGARWRQYKHRVGAEAKKEPASIDKLCAAYNCTPEQLTQLLDYMETPEFQVIELVPIILTIIKLASIIITFIYEQALSERGKEAIKKNTNPHRLGSKSYVEAAGSWPLEETKTSSSGAQHVVSCKRDPRSWSYLLARCKKGKEDKLYFPDEASAELASRVVSRPLFTFFKR